MKQQSWLRRRWLLAAGGAFVAIHAATWLMQRAVKNATRAEAELRQKAPEQRID